MDATGPLECDAMLNLRLSLRQATQSLVGSSCPDISWGERHFKTLHAACFYNWCMRNDMMLTR